jgi:hypothetical protein
MSRLQTDAIKGWRVGVRPELDLRFRGPTPHVTRFPNRTRLLLRVRS